MDRISRINPLLEILKSSPQRVNKILVQKDSHKQDIGEIVRLSKRNRISLQFAPKKRLDLLDRKHQGVVALVQPKAFISVDAILESAELPFLLLLDGVQDPQNLGAIIRTAEGAGIDGLVLPATGQGTREIEVHIKEWARQPVKCRQGIVRRFRKPQRLT